MELEAVEKEFETGDTIRWTDKGYTYVAVMAAGKWYLSGGASYYGTSVMTPAQLVKVLRRSHIDRLDYATVWATIRITD